MHQPATTVNAPAVITNDISIPTTQVALSMCECPDGSILLGLHLNHSRGKVAVAQVLRELADFLTALKFLLILHLC